MRQPHELRAYQQRMITHLYNNDEAFCIVRPGGGKTIAALTAIKELKRDGVIRHALVIAPKRVAYQVWPDELYGWQHTNGAIFATLDGKPEDRKHKLRYPDIVTSKTDKGLTFVGIDLTTWLLEELDKLPDDHPHFDLLVLDEISKFKDPTGVRAKALAKRAHRFKIIWGLSGTLRPNSSLDLFTPVRIVTRGKLWGRSFYSWRQQRFRPTDFKGYNWTPLQGTEDQLNAELAPYVVTLRENEMPQLPELSIIQDRVELPDKAKVYYRQMHRELMTTLGVDENKPVLAPNAAVATGKLAQIANGFVYDKPKTHAIHDEKREWLADLVEQATGPALIVYEFAEDLEMIRDVCGRTVPFLGAGVGNKEAAYYITAWNMGKLPFMALHPAAGGHGLNLQKGGSDLWWVSPTWSPELWEQTIARLHRPGQGHHVMVRVCVATGTVDDMKLDRCHRKIDAQKSFERYLSMFEEGIGTT